VNDDLAAFWIRADLEDPAFTGDEVKRWPASIRSLLESRSLIRRSENLRVIECDACGDRHVEEVEILAEPAGTKPRAYITCPEAGRVSVDMDRLHQWSIDLEALARTVTAALDLPVKVVSITPGRVWLLGTRKFVERMQDVFLVRGVTWPDSRQVLDSTARLANSPCPLILCLNRFPDDPEWQDRSRVVFSLAETSWLGDQQPVLADRAAAVLREHTGPRGLDPLPPTPAAQRPRLMEQIETRYNYRVKDIHQGAKVDRSYLNKWKLGLVDDDSDPSRRIENFLRRHRHIRRLAKQSRNHTLTTPATLI
jgi:hypothetical protein